MTARNGEKRIHVRWISEGVNGNDCSGFVRDRLFGPLWIHVESDGINVDKDGICSHIANRVGDSDEGEGRYNDFVPRSYTESKHAKVEARSSGAYADGVGNTRVSGNGVPRIFRALAPGSNVNCATPPRQLLFLPEICQARRAESSWGSIRARCPLP